MNGQALSAQLNVYVTNPVLANITWGTVSPTTIVAGGSMSVNGQALDMSGNPIINTPIQIYFKEGGATVQTVTTNGTGNFTATLTPTNIGTKTLLAQIGNGIVQYPTPITVIPGPPTSGTMTFGYASPLLSNDTFSITVHIQDALGDNNTYYPVTFSILANSLTATVSTTVNTDANGNATVSNVATKSGTSGGYVTVSATAGTLNLSQQLYVTQAVAVSQSSSLDVSTTNWGYATLHLNVKDQKGRPITVQVTMSGSGSTNSGFNGENTTSGTASGQQLFFNYYSYGQQNSNTPKTISSGDIPLVLSFPDYFQCSGSSSMSVGYILNGQSHGASMTWSYPSGIYYNTPVTGYGSVY